MSLSDSFYNFDVTIKKEHESIGFYSDWEAWHQKHLSWVSDPFGYLSIIELHWLDHDRKRFHSIPGEWWVNQGKVRVRLAENESFKFENKDIKGEFEFDFIEDRGSAIVSLLTSKLEVAKRGGVNLLRLRSPESEVLKRFTGVPAYYPDPKWCVDAIYKRHDVTISTRVGAVFEDVYHTYDATGIVHFKIGLEQHSLTTFDYGEQLLILFTDSTSGNETYGAQRAIYLPKLGDNEVFKLDFNRAVNIMCAYSDFCPCPLPPNENNLKVSIRAGEKKPL